MGSDQPLRVLWVDHVRRILGGAEVNLVELLGDPESAAGWDSVVACDPEGRLHDALEQARASRVAYGLDDALGRLRIVGGRFPLAGAARSLRVLRQARADLERIVADARPQVVVSCTNKDHFAVWRACRRAGIPCVWWVNDILSSDFFPWAARKAFVHQARRGASRLVAVSEFARRALVSEGVPEGRVVAIQNGIPLERYQRRERGALRSMLNLGDAELLVGVVGRFTPWKGQDFFLRLAEAWSRKSPVGHFALIGHAFNEDQEYEGRLREFARERGLRDRVHFVPFQKDIAAALSDLDLLAHTSLKPEPFGRVIIEAMAVGTPVLAARGGGAAEIINPGEDGLLAEPGSLSDYLRAMEVVLTDPQTRARLSARGRRAVETRFGLDRVRGEFDRLFRTCIS
jgi:glycosyltransferase involved in cell wall biosynthesis